MYLLYQVHPKLAPFVDCFWTSTFDQMTIPCYDELFVGQLSPNIIFNLSASYQRNGEWVTSAMVENINTSAINFSHQPENNLFGIRFKPCGLSLFSKVGAHEFCNTALHIEDVFGKKGSELAEKIANAVTTLERIKITEGYLFTEIKPDLLNKWQFYTDAHAEILQTCAEPLCIPQILKKMNTTQRTFDRHFQQILGITPKKMSRLLRFQQTFAAMHQLDFRLSNFDFYAFGYYDQAHFSKEFKEFSGFAPQHYLQSPHFVQNLQDNHF